MFCWVSNHVRISGKEKADYCQICFWIYLVSRLRYPILILNFISDNILFPLDKMFGMVWLEQASFCQASPGRLAVILQAVQEG